MCALGLGLGTSVDVVGSGAAAVAIEDYVFELDASDNLQPRNIDYDFSDILDVSSTEISPAATPTEEGYFDILPSGNIIPKS